MMDDIDLYHHDTFEELLNDLKSRSKTSRDPRIVRLSSVTSALVDVIHGDITASKVYASAVTTLEATLKTTKSSSESKDDDDSFTFSEDSYECIAVNPSLKRGLNLDVLATLLEEGKATR